MKLFNALVSISLLIATLSSCSQSNKFANSPHGQLLSEQARVKAEHKNIGKSIKDTKKETEELIENFRAIITDDSGPLSKLMKDESLIIEIEGTLKGHEAIFEQNETLFAKHEDSPLSPKEIEAQHKSITNNLDDIKGDLISIKTKNKLIINRQEWIINNNKTE